jgi:hypothetical protein
MGRNTIFRKCRIDLCGIGLCGLYPLSLITRGGQQEKNMNEKKIITDAEKKLKELNEVAKILLEKLVQGMRDSAVVDNLQVNADIVYGSIAINMVRNMLKDKKTSISFREEILNLLNKYPKADINDNGEK